MNILGLRVFLGPRVWGRRLRAPAWVSRSGPLRISHGPVQDVESTSLELQGLGCLGFGEFGVQGV